MSAKEIEDFSRKLSTMDTSKAITEMVSKLNEMGATAAEKRFVLESLASGLGDLLPLYENNAKALNDYEEKLREAGVIRTNEAIANSQVLAAQTGSLQLKFQGLKNQLADKMTPALSAVINQFTDGSKTGNAMSVVMAALSITIKTTATVFITLGAVVQGVVRTVMFAVNQLGNVGTTLYNSFSALLRGDLLGAGKALMNGVNYAVGEAKETFIDFGNIASSVVKNSKSVWAGIANTNDDLAQSQINLTKMGRS